MKTINFIAKWWWTPFGVLLIWLVAVAILTFFIPFPFSRAHGAPFSTKNEGTDLIVFMTSQSKKLTIEVEDRVPACAGWDFYTRKQIWCDKGTSRNVKLYDLLIKLREFIKDNDEQAQPTFAIGGGVYMLPPSRAQLIEQEIKGVQAELEKLNRETALRKDIEAIIKVMEGKE